MKLLKITVLIGLIFPPWVSAEICESYSEELTGSSGSVKLSGDICLVNNSYDGEVNGTVNIAYSEYSADGSISADGSVILNYTSDSVSPAASMLKVTYNGGPVNYTVGGQIYEVEFKDLSYTFDGEMNQTSESGNILLDGVSVDAKDTPYNYVKLF